MARSRFEATLKDRSGNAIQNALFHVFEEGTENYVSDLFLAETGGSALSPATLTTDNEGRVVGYLGTSRDVDLKRTDNGHAAYYSGDATKTLTFAADTVTIAVGPPPGDYATVASVDAHLNDASGAHAASAISVSPSGGIASTNAQAALEELDSEKETPAGAAAQVTAHSNLATGVHGVGASTVESEAGSTAKADAAQAASQPVDADLTAVAALDSSIAGAIASDGAGWIKKTFAQFKSALGLVKGDVGLGNVDNTSDANKPVSGAQQAALDAEASARASGDALLIPLTQKGAANGVATLGADSLIPSSQLPAIALGDETFTVASQAAMLALAAHRGDLAKRTDLAPVRTFILTSDSPSTLADWLEVASDSTIVSVNGQAGVVVLGPADVGADASGSAASAQAAAEAAAASALNGHKTSSDHDGRYYTETEVDNALAAKVPKSLYDANTVLKADTDDTPVALPVGEQTLLGRVTGGSIGALTPAQIRTLLSVVDDAFVAHLAGTETFTGTKTFQGDLYAKSGRPWVDIIAHGADPTGTADSTAAITAAAAGGNKVVFVPPGTFLVDALALPAGTKLMGAGRNLSVLKFRSASTGYLIDVAAADVRVEYLKLDGNRSVATGSTGTVRLNGATGFRLAHCWVTSPKTFALAYQGTSNSDISIEDNIFDDIGNSGIDQSAGGAFTTGHTMTDFQIINNRIIKLGGTAESGAGIRLTGCVRGIIRNNYVDGGGSKFLNGLSFGLGSSDLTVSGNISRRNRDDGLTLYYGTKRVAVTGNVFVESVGTSGVFVIDGSGSGLGAPYTDPCESIEIVGNTLDNNALAGVRFEGLINSSIVGNSCCRGGRFGILEPGSGGTVSKNLTIADNTICENDESGVNVAAGSMYLITGNIIRNNGKDTAAGERSGIILNATDYCQITNNQISDDQATRTMVFGIRLLNADHCLVAGNYVRGTKEEGIYLDTSTENKISGNRVYETSQGGHDTKDGIRLLNSSTGNTVSENKVRKAASSPQTRHGINCASNSNVIINNDLVNSGNTSALTDTGTGTVRHGNIGDAKLRGTATWDAASVADGAMTSTTVTVTDAAIGDLVHAWHAVAVPAGAILAGQVTASGTVTVTLFNKTGSALDLTSATLTALAEKRAA